MQRLRHGSQESYVNRVGDARSVVGPPLSLRLLRTDQAVKVKWRDRFRKHLPPPFYITTHVGL